MRCLNAIIAWSFVEWLARKYTVLVSYSIACSSVEWLARKYAVVE